MVVGVLILCVVVFLVVRSRLVCYFLPSELGLPVVKTAETIESLTQPELLYSGLPNNAELSSEDRSRILLEKMADQATALMLAELAVTQDDGSAVAVEEGRIAAGGSTSHIGKT